MPERIEQLWSALGMSIDPSAGQLRELAAWGDTLAGSSVKKVALFPRLEQPAPA